MQNRQLVGEIQVVNQLDILHQNSPVLFVDQYNIQNQWTNMFTKYKDFKGSDDILYKLAKLITSLKRLIKKYKPKTADH